MFANSRFSVTFNSFGIRYGLISKNKKRAANIYSYAKLFQCIIRHMKVTLVANSDNRGTCNDVSAAEDERQAHQKAGKFVL